MKRLLALARSLHSRCPWILHWVLPLVFFLLCSFYYQGTVTRCGDYLMSGPGDQTAGLIWLHSVVPGSPLWGHTDVTNYPFGETLRQPAHWSGAALYLWYWLLASAVGGICGYNLLNIIGFFTAAVAMYAFVKWLTRKPGIALLCGYAAAFAPYYQAKSSGHPSYVYQGVFVLSLWLFLLFWRNPRWQWAVCLGALTGATFYIDPYFVLLAIVLLGSLFFGGVAYDVVTRQVLTWRRKSLALLMAMAVGIIVLLPLVYVRVHYAAQIDQSLVSARGDIMGNAWVYSARPSEYLLPVETHPVLKALFGPGYSESRYHHGSNPSEYTINLSLTLLALVLVVAVVLYRRWRTTGRFWPEGTDLELDPKLVAIMVVSAGIIAAVSSLPPVFYGFYFPSYLIFLVTTMWRVLARLFVIVNISLVITAALALAALWPLVEKGWRRGGLVALLLLGVVFEYQAYPVPRPVWSFRDNTPDIYERLANRSDIKSIAEYSLDEQPQSMAMFYQTYQWVHHKALFNSALADSPEASLRAGLKDLEDPQTLPALRSLGVDAIVVHGIAGDINVPGLERIDYEANPPANASQVFKAAKELYPIGLYRVLPGTKTDRVETLESGFVNPTMASYVSYDYVGGSGSVMALRSLSGGTAGTGRVCLQIRSTSKDTEVASIRTGDGQLAWSGRLTGEWQPVEFDSPLNQSIVFWVDQPGRASFTVDDLGCKP